MASTNGIKRKYAPDKLRYSHESPLLMNSRFSDVQMVLLVVGRGKTEISVHENVLLEASPVFKTAFTSRFKESSKRSIYLPEDNADLMDTLVQSLYAPESRLSGIDTTMQLLRLYVLADKYDIVKIKNRICEDFLFSLIGMMDASFHLTLRSLSKLCAETYKPTGCVKSFLAVCARIELRFFRPGIKQACIALDELPRAW